MVEEESKRMVRKCKEELKIIPEGFEKDSISSCRGLKEKRIQRAEKVQRRFRCSLKSILKSKPPKVHCIAILDGPRMV